MPAVGSVTPDCNHIVVSVQAAPFNIALGQIPPAAGESAGNHHIALHNGILDLVKQILALVAGRQLIADRLQPDLLVIVDPIVQRLFHIPAVGRPGNRLLLPVVGLVSKFVSVVAGKFASVQGQSAVVLDNIINPRRAGTGKIVCKLRCKNSFFVARRRIPFDVRILGMQISGNGIGKLGISNALRSTGAQGSLIVDGRQMGGADQRKAGRNLFLRQHLMLHDHRNIRTVIVIHIDVLIFRRGRFRSAFLISIGGRLGVSCGRDRFSAGSEDGSQHQKSQNECYQFFHNE